MKFPFSSSYIEMKSKKNQNTNKSIEKETNKNKHTNKQT